MSGDVIVTITLNAALHVAYTHRAIRPPRASPRSPGPATGPAAAA